MARARIRVTLTPIVTRVTVSGFCYSATPVQLRIDNDVSGGRGWSVSRCAVVSGYGFLARERVAGAARRIPDT
ncbi:hypothetical protein GS4_05_02680 [Gordonia soli NBRC 108243]|uniref:Uncharacterized protein n=1 Tax=Gordonia soli NBRC 108243 TaxID=1223545 RepID=M0QEN2_9ACTN|nr:hypothetical protein GS4_05_02680 [Gordonia soli NBRC 108243]